jgi:hypothetical protein
MRNPRAANLYDSLRIEVGRTGAIASPTPQNERPVQRNSFYAAMESSGVGQAWTTSRSSRTFSAGTLSPQGWMSKQPAGFEDIATDAGKHMNARAALPNRGIQPHSPLMRRR